MVRLFTGMVGDSRSYQQTNLTLEKTRNWRNTLHKGLLEVSDTWTAMVSGDEAAQRKLQHWKIRNTNSKTTEPNVPESNMCKFPESHRTSNRARSADENLHKHNSNNTRLESRRHNIYSTHETPANNNLCQTCGEIETVRHITTNAQPTNTKDKS